MCCKMFWKFCEIWKILWELASRWAKFCEIKFCEILSHSVRYGTYAVGQSWSNFTCSITRGGERLHVLRQIGSKCWCPWQQKAPFTYNGENGVSTFSRLLLIRSFLNLQVMRTCIKSRTRLNFGQVKLLTMELAALVRLNISHRLIMGKWCLHASSFIFDRIIIKLLVTRTGHRLIMGKWSLLSVVLVEFMSKFLVKVSLSGYISRTIHQKEFIFGPWVP